MGGVSQQEPTWAKKQQEFELNILFNVLLKNKQTIVYADEIMNGGSNNVMEPF